jgi:hypothetical protein
VRPAPSRAGGDRGRIGVPDARSRARCARWFFDLGRNSRQVHLARCRPGGRTAPRRGTRCRQDQPAGAVLSRSTTLPDTFRTRGRRRCRWSARPPAHPWPPAAAARWSARGGGRAAWGCRRNRPPARPAERPGPPRAARSSRRGHHVVHREEAGTSSTVQAQPEPAVECACRRRHRLIRGLRPRAGAPRARPRRGRRCRSPAPTRARRRSRSRRGTRRAGARAPRQPAPRSRRPPR